MMTKKNYFSVLILFGFLFQSGNMLAQEIKNVTVKYKQITKIELPSFGGPEQNPERAQRMKDMMANMPEEGNFAYKLTIINNKAVYTDNPAEQEAPAPELERAMHIMSRLNPPTATIKSVYFDLDKQEYIKKLDFMTREFIINSEMEAQAWKLKGEQKMILDYVCMNAELQIGESTIEAWFTPQLPYSIGPEEYYGLPGLILAVEKNGKTIFVAKSIELNKTEIADLSKPEEGKNISQKAFDELMAEMKKEHEEQMKQRQMMGPNHGPGGGRR